MNAKYILAILVCGAELFAWILIGVALGWRHGGGFLLLVILFSIVGWTWRTITKIKT